MSKKFSIAHIKSKLISSLFLINDRITFAFNIHKNSSDISDKILYIGEYFPARIQRLLKVIKEDIPLKKILLISKWGYEPKLIGDVFDEVIIYRNKYHLKNILKSIHQVKLIHGFEPKAEFQYYVKSAINAPFIYDLQDIIITYYGYHPPLNWQKKNLQFEEKLINESDGFISYSLELNEAQRLYKTKTRPVKRLFFPLYCDELNFKSISTKAISKRPKIVYIGGINSMNDSSSSNFYPLIKKLSQKDIEITIFPSPFSERLHYEEYKRLEKEFTNFKMEKSVPFNQLNISNFDFGVVPFEHETSEKYYTKNRYASTLKFFVYLEMGLPILISEYWAFPAWITKRYNLGIVTSYNQLDSTNIQLSEEEYRTILSNIEKFRNKFSLQKNKDRIVNFYLSFL